jgi:hypothetical protein
LRATETEDDRERRENDEVIIRWEVQIGQELPNDEEQDQYLFKNIDFDFDTAMDIAIVQIFQRFFGTQYQLVVINYRTGDQLFVGPELFASLGLDLMEVGSNSVTLRTGKHANKRTIAFALQALLALFDTKETTRNDNNNNSDEVSSDKTSNENIHSIMY